MSLPSDHTSHSKFTFSLLQLEGLIHHRHYSRRDKRPLSTLKQHSMKPIKLSWMIPFQAIILVVLVVATACLGFSQPAYARKSRVHPDYQRRQRYYDNAKGGIYPRKGASPPWNHHQSSDSSAVVMMDQSSSSLDSTLTTS